MASKAESLFEEIGGGIPDAKLSKMFGCRCIKSPNGKASVLLWRENLVVKPPKESLEGLLKSGYEMFTPAEGKSMNGWIVIPRDQSAKWKNFAQEAYEYVATLPAK
jgi:hypothetical protein